MTNSRRPIESRSFQPLQNFAAFLSRTQVTPNQISVCSIVCAGVAAAALLLLTSWLGYLLAAVAIQLRLLCNVVDGLVAVEGGKKSALGVIYNEFPDRIADSLIIVSAGYAANVPWLGWVGALLAVTTAYIRAFGCSVGLAPDFQGPMAKPQRMAVLTVGCVVGAVVHIFTDIPFVLMGALSVVVVGSAVTCWNRTGHIASQLQTNSSN